MANIDGRLLDCLSAPGLTENFNRILSEIDGLKAAITCQIAFDSDGGSSVDTQYVPYNGKAAAAAAPTKSGSTFNGWFDGSNAYDFALPVTKNLVLKAHWTTS